MTSQTNMRVAEYVVEAMTRIARRYVEEEKPVEADWEKARDEELRLIWPAWGLAGMDDLARLRNEAKSELSAIRAVVEVIEDALAAEIGKGGKVRFGGEFFEAKPKTNLRLREGAEPLVWGRLEEKASEGPDAAESVFDGLRKAFNLNNIRTGAFDDLDSLIQEETVDEDTGEIVVSVFSDFWERVGGDNTIGLAVRPLSRAPKFAAELPEGEPRWGRGKGSPVRPEEDTVKP